MKISTFEDNNLILSTRNLVSYLSQIVLTKIDENIENKKYELDSITNEIVDLKTSLNDKKNRLIRLQEEMQRLEVLSKTLDVMNTLKQEGVLIGKNKNKISDLLNNIFDQPIEKLQALQSRFLTYVNTDNNRVTVS